MRREDKHLVTIAITSVLALCCTGDGVMAGNNPSERAELVCKLRSDGNVSDDSFWTIYIVKSTGQLVGRDVSQAGDSVKFKDLDSGIYIVCLQNDQRRKCRSVDLTIPEGGKSIKSVQEIDIPRATLNRPFSYTVGVEELSTPQEAVDELVDADRALQQGKTSMFLRHVQRALAIFPRYIKALNNLGVYWHRQREYEAAIRYLQEAAEIQPEYGMAWANLASSYLAIGDFDKALDASLKAVHLEPDNAQAVSLAALSHYYLKRSDQAEEYFKRLLALDPANAMNPQLYLYHLALGEGDRAGAAEYLRSFLHHHPNSQQAPRFRLLLGALVAQPDSLERQGADCQLDCGFDSAPWTGTWRYR
jgi:Tfp pilus assembly protein PilF